VVEIEHVVEDKPGVLAKISGTLGRNGVNILFSESDELEGIGLGAIVAVVDTSGIKITLDELRNELESIPEVKEITLKPLE